MSNVLSNLSETLTETVESVGPSLVRIEGRRRMAASGIVWTEDGLVVTANHVVKRDQKLVIGLPDGQGVEAELVGRDPSTDLALIKVEASDLKPASRNGHSDEEVDLAVGQLVLALGRPGRTVQATLGIISALGDSWRTGAGGQIDRYLQTDVLMYPGFSGGPLVNSQGHVIGLNTSALLRGISMAVPVTTVDKVVGTLLTHGRMRRGYLGVSTQPARLPEGVKDEVGQETGLLIVSVESSSPAGDAGLVMGDAIVGLDGKAVRHHDDLLILLTGERVGKKVPVNIVRGGEIRTLEVMIGER